jgi:hypothetical protein
MDAIQTLQNDITAALSGNEIYNSYQDHWRYLLESYLGGEEYRKAGHLTRYQLETDGEYQARLRTTPLENHCASVVSVYNSFLFRRSPDREFMSIAAVPELDPFLWNCDMDGRNFDQFMKDTSTWSSVFGHAWVLMVKPDIGALSRADEIAAGVRPYLTLLTPLVVTDWSYTRSANGSYQLSYFKYVEDVNGDVRTIREWWTDRIRTFTVNAKDRTVIQDITEPNGLGKIPAVCVYNGRSTVRGIGVSDITDIADAQKFIYNATSEVEQSIRMNTHPSLVKTPETQAGIGAGSLIHMPENLDPGLKPYLLEFNGGSVQSIYQAIEHAIDSIDKMANTGAVRATQSRTLSGIAMETEFQLLNARLSEKGDLLEIAEEGVWQLFCDYLGYQWDGYVKYPDSFNLRDKDSEIKQLQSARQTATDPRVFRKIDEHILEWMGEEKEILAYEDITPEPGRTYPDGEPIPESLPPLYIDSSDSQVPTGQNCANCEYYKGTEKYCMKFDAPVRPMYWCAKWEKGE